MNLSSNGFVSSSVFDAKKVNFLMYLVNLFVEGFMLCKLVGWRLELYWLVTLVYIA